MLIPQPGHCTAGDAASDVFVPKGLKECALGNQLAIRFCDSIRLSMTFYAKKKKILNKLYELGKRQFNNIDLEKMSILYFRRHFSEKKLSDYYLLVCIAFAGFQGLIKMRKVLHADLLSMC